MVLASHIIISGLLGSQTQNYFLAGAIGLASHYLLDAVPHWDNYLSPQFKTKAETEDGKFLKEKFFWKEISKVFLDVFAGLALFFVFITPLGYQNVFSAFIGIFFGILPDALQLLYFLTHSYLLKPNYELQHFLHQEKKPGLAFGMFTQIAVIAATLVAALMLR